MSLISRVASSFRTELSRSQTQGWLAGMIFLLCLGGMEWKGYHIGGVDTPFHTAVLVLLPILFLLPATLSVGFFWRRVGLMLVIHVPFLGVYFLLASDKSPFKMSQSASTWAYLVAAMVEVALLRYVASKIIPNDQNAESAQGVGAHADSLR